MNNSRADERSHGPVQQSGIVTQLDEAVKRPGAVASRVSDPNSTLPHAVTRVDAIYAACGKRVRTLPVSRGLTGGALA